MENINSPTRKHHFNKGCDLFADLVISNCILRRLSLARPNQTTILKNLRPTVKHLTMHLTLLRLTGLSRDGGPGSEGHWGRLVSGHRKESASKRHSSSVDKPIRRIRSSECGIRKADIKRYCDDRRTSRPLFSASFLSLSSHPYTFARPLSPSFSSPVSSHPLSSALPEQCRRRAKVEIRLKFA